MGVTISLSYQSLSQCPLPNVIAPTQNQVVLGKAQELVVCIMMSRAKIITWPRNLLPWNKIGWPANTLL